MNARIAHGLLALTTLFLTGCTYGIRHDLFYRAHLDGCAMDQMGRAYYSSQIGYFSARKDCQAHVIAEQFAKPPYPADETRAEAPVFDAPLMSEVAERMRVKYHPDKDPPRVAFAKQADMLEFQQKYLTDTSLLRSWEPQEIPTDPMKLSYDQTEEAINVLNEMISENAILAGSQSAVDVIWAKRRAQRLDLLRRQIQAIRSNRQMRSIVSRASHPEVPIPTR